MNNSVKLTPMLQQYLEIKAEHPDAILFYRMGDFYEMFFDDALTASKILGITLTSRSHKDDAHKVPMCGIPFHALDSYLGKMIRAGFRVALCEQTEDPKQAKGIVQRGVTRVVSPGVTTDDQVLEARANRYVCGLALLPGTSGKKDTAGLAFLDISTGNFQVCQIPLGQEHDTALLDQLGRMAPAELLISPEDQNRLEPLLHTIGMLLPGLCITNRDGSYFDRDGSKHLLLEHFRTTNLAGFGCEELTVAVRAAGGLLRYIRETQKSQLAHVRQVTPLSQNGFLLIDESSRRNLELTETSIGGKREGSLLSVLDRTATPMGARYLRNQLLFPLQDRQRIKNRLDGIEALLADGDLRRLLLAELDNIHDLERLCGRLVLGHGNGRDMVALRDSLQPLPAVKKALAQAASSILLQDIGNQLDPLTDLQQLLASAIRDDAPVSLREGRLIREGFHAGLDELIILVRDGKQLILQLEGRERERTGLHKLKLGYNKVFGYYFELSKNQSERVPDDFIRKQTLVGAERFITPALKELENRIEGALEKRIELEYTLFGEVRDTVSRVSERILQSARQVARLDMLLSLAEVARRYHFSKPELTDDHTITIIEGRHPVIERTLESGRFVPNDIHLDQEQHELLLITGPNMAGKSTVLRQTALIVLLAHMGSFVPAERATICLVDRIFTRVGAMDDLRRGQSTFMVEMNETANILNNASENSLVILDEIGRGTSTYDGLAIAWAVAEDLADRNGRGVKTLFATHYHELTELAASHPRIRNYSVAVREWNDSIIFLHKLVEGAISRSYGIQVASLAGVPDRVVGRAHEILASIENKEQETTTADRLKRQSMRWGGNTHAPFQLTLFPAKPDRLRHMLTSASPDEMTPRQALDLLYALHNLLREEEDG